MVPWYCDLNGVHVINICLLDSTKNSDWLVHRTWHSAGQPWPHGVPRFVFAKYDASVVIDRQKFL